MAKLQFWNDNDFKTPSNTFNATQRRSYFAAQAWNSYKTDADTWAVIWDGSNCTGNYMKIGGNNASSNNDLNKTKRGDDGDWKNQIKSLMMYSSQPSWWNSSGIPPTDLSDLGSNQSIACTNTDFYDDTKVFNGAESHSNTEGMVFPTDTTRDMKNNIESIAIGPSVWMEVWNDLDYTGDWLKIKPGSRLDNLEDYDRPSGLGDWKNQIQSMKIFTSKPACWDLYIDMAGFNAMFPDYTQEKDTSGKYLTYTTQDCNYDVRLTNQSYSDTTLMVSFRVDYSITAGTNDKALLDLTVNADGSLNSVTYSYQQSDGAVEIPSTLIKAVDKTAELLGALGALETAGISEEAAEDFIVAFDTFCKVFNEITKLLYKSSEANDGRFYMIAVCLHTLCRAFSNIKSS